MELPVPQSYYTICKISILIMSERPCQPKIGELKYTLIIYQKIGPWAKDDRACQDSYSSNKDCLNRDTIVSFKLTFDIPMKDHMKMAVMKSRQQLLHVTLK